MNRSVNIDKSRKKSIEKVQSKKKKKKNLKKLKFTSDLCMSF